MLNRIIEPSVRTDSESQEAAHQLTHIARRLRQAKYRQTPRTLIWPFPIFIAAIEITDEIDQDWALGYLTELSDWGNNMKKAKDLLERVLERQKAEGKRVNVSEIIANFGFDVII